MMNKPVATLHTSIWSRGHFIWAIAILASLAIVAGGVWPTSLAAESQSSPDTPDRPTGTAVFVGGVDLEWNDVARAESYDVQMYRNGQWTDLPGDGIEVAFYGAGAIVSELEPEGSSYWFRARARNAHGFSEWSDYNFMAPTSESKSGRQARPDNVPASGELAINGTAQVGESLSADTTGIEDGNGLDRVKFRFQWVSHDGSADTDIANATDSTYALVADDEGKTIKMRVAFTDRGGYDESLTGGETAAVAARPNSPATGAPSITGTVQVGETLTADTSGISDADGLTKVSYSYQWVANDGTADTDITNATDSTYTLAAADEGRTIKVRVAFTDDAGNEETLASSATAAVESAPNTPATGAPAIVGTTQVGETLTADTSGISDADGLTKVSYSYQWVANDGTADTDITNATDSTYTLAAADEGRTIKVRVAFTDDAGNEETLASPATAAVEAAPNTPAAGAPAIVGTAQVGETLTADTSGISDADGLTKVSYSNQWVANDGTADTDITNATDSTYTLAAADEGRTIKVTVSFTDDAGNEETVTSSATAAVEAAANTPATGAPAITGTAQVGETLTANTTGIADADGLTGSMFAYQWLANNAVVVGATGGVYVLTTSEMGKTIKVRVSFTDDAGNEETLTSTATGTVSPAVQPQKANNPATGAPTISGTTQVGEILAADTTGIADADGLTNATFTYQWMWSFGSSNDSDIAGATGSTYTPVTGDLGFMIKVRVSFTDDAGNEETLTSEATSDVQWPNAPAPQLSALGVSHGTLTPVFDSETTSYTVPDVPNPVTRTTITATPETGSAVDFFETTEGGVSQVVSISLGPASIPADDPRCSTGFEDSGGPMVELTDADLNTPGFQVDLYDGENRVWVRVYEIDRCALSVGYNLVITRAEGAVSRPRPNNPAGGILWWYHPLGVISPGYKGYVIPGQTTRSVGPWFITDRDGMANATFGYQWLADDAEIPGATGTSYNVTWAELGKTLKVRATFTDDRGTEETVFSSNVEVKLPNIEPSGKPVILGTLEAGQTLIADVSSIWDRNGMTNAIFSYEWVGFAGPVTDAAEYTLVDGDEGQCECWLRVTYTDDDGHEEVVSSLTIGVVAPSSNSPATGGPTIGGTAQVGETLTADTSGIADADGLTNAFFTYQWIANDGTSDADIVGATDSTYTLVAADQGRTIKVRVSFTDNAGYDETLASAATDEVSFAVQQQVANSPATGAPTISGPVQVEETLTADTSSIADGDGLTHVTYSYQWIRNDGSSDTDITSATGYSYTLLVGDVGKTIKVQVSFTDDAGNEETLTSPPTALVQPRPNSPVIRGTARVGAILTADTSDITDPDGVENAVFAHQWIAGGADIEGATGTSYTIASDDEGLVIQVWVSFTDDDGNPETRTSDGTEPVEPETPPNTPATGVPTITGTARVGETLTVDTSGVTDAEGMDNAVFTYRWTAGGTDIPDATGASHTLTGDEDGLVIQVWVSFSDDGGNREALASAATEAVAAPEPPAKPTGLSAASVSHDAVTLTWDDPQDDSITGYVVLRRDPEIHPSGTFVTITADTGSVNTTYTDDTVEPETRYVYRIQALNEYGAVSERSHWIVANTPAVPVPAKPTGLSTVSVSHDGVSLTWDDPQDDSITGYVILRRDRAIHPGGTFVTIAGDTGSADTSYTDDTVEPDKQYVYRIQAINNHGVSERSHWVRANTPAAPAPAG